MITRTLEGIRLTQLRRPGPLSERLGSLRVGHLGREALDLLGSRVQSVKIGPDWEPASEAEHWIDVLVIGGDLGEARDADVRRIVTDARSAGIPTIGYVSRKPDLALRGLVDLTVSPAGGPGPVADMSLGPLVDLDRVSPMGAVPPIERGSLLALRSHPRWTDRRSLRSFDRLLDLETPSRAGTPWAVTISELGRSSTIAPMLQELRAAWGVVDDESLHSSRSLRSHYLAQLAMAGVPFRLFDRSPDVMDGVIGTELRSAASGPIEDLLDPDERERISVRQRRIALKRFTDWGRWEEIADLLDLPMRPRPTVSIILATNRPEQLEHALHQIRIQTYQPLELILVLHGDGFGDDARRSIAERYPRAHSLRVDGSRSLGEALNAGVDLATGALVTKMDDDDWYGTEHLWDLVHAMEYSGAELVGKAAEWVYLAELDVTMRRFNSGAESGSATLAGGTMMMHRSDLLSVGGFRRARRHVDLGLIDDVRRLGGTTYRTHGFGYLLRRTAGGHTWDIGVDYFLQQSSTQVRGLSREAPILPANTASATLREVQP